jgi:hypothetical protein
MCQLLTEVTMYVTVIDKSNDMGVTVTDKSNDMCVTY